MKRLALVALFAACAACGSRTELDAAGWDPPSLYCTAQPFAGRPSRDVLLVAGVPRAYRSLARWSVATQVAGSSASIRANGDQATFSADREGEYSVRVAVPAADGGPGAEVSCTVPVHLEPGGPTATCPASITVAPLARATLQAAAQGDRAIVRNAWTLVSAPAASARPQPQPATELTTRFTPDAAGDYVLRFQTTDSAGATDACTTTVHAVTADGLRVELWWDPPGHACPLEARAECDHADVDLHLLEGVPAANWRSELDCYYGNCTGPTRPHWDTTASTAADPHLDLDDTDGHGPENIDIAQPPVGARYRIGVHYYATHGAGPEAATLAVFCGGTSPVARLGPVTLTFPGNSYLQGDFWIAADVILQPGGCRVVSIVRNGGPWIVSMQDALATPGPQPP